MDGTLLTPAMLIKFQTASNAYIKDPTLPVAAFQQLPSSYYTISNSSTMVIKKGQHMGSVVIRADSTNFLADAATKFRLTFCHSGLLMLMQIQLLFRRIMQLSDSNMRICFLGNTGTVVPLWSTDLS